MNRTTVLVGVALPVVVALGMVLALLLVFEPDAASQSCGGGSSVGPTTAAGIPQSLMPFYDGAAGQYQLGPDGWAYLAAVNNVETDFGQNISTSSAGAVGWMQFEPGTWATYGVTPTGAKAPDGPAGWNDPGDAIYSAANYLQASGAPGDWAGAIYTYNHAGWYVSKVEGIAAQYIATAAKAAGPGVGGIGTGLPATGTTPGAGATTAVPEPGETTGAGAAGTGAAGAGAGATGVGAAGGQGTAAGTAAPAPGDTGGSVGCGVTGKSIPGQTAKIEANGTADVPADAPLQVQLAIAAGNRIIDTYYNAQRPEYLDRLYPWYDCSASTDWVLYHSQLNLPGVTVGGSSAGDSSDLETFGDSGAGQWITVFASSGHAFIEVAGIVLDTAHFAPTMPGGSGPRWQPASILPSQLADGNVWTQRHPPGL